MVPYYGDYPASHTAVCIPFASFAAATGAPSATTNFAAGDILIYKNGGTAERSSANGITVSTSFDSKTGLQMVVIDLSDNTDAGFYAAGNEYSVAVGDITVDSQTVRFWLGTFSIERANGMLALLKSATFGLSALKTLIDTIDDFVDTEIGDIQSRLPAALVGGRMDASVGAVANNAITAAAIADGAIDRATFAADTGLQAIRSNTAQAGGATSITLDASASATNDFYKGAVVFLTGGTGAGQYRLITAYNGTSKAATVTPAWATNPDNTSTFAVLPRGAADVEAWLGSAAPANTGDAFARLGAPAGASVSADIAAVKAETASIQSDTNDIQTRLPAALISGRMDSSVGAMANDVVTAAAIADNAIDAGAIASDAITSAKIATDAIGAAELAAGAVNKIRDAILSDSTAFAGADIAAIKGKTDNLPSDPADASVIAGRFDTLDTSIADLPTNAELATALGTADDAVLAQVALVKAKTDNLPSDPADQSLIIAATDAITAAIAGLNDLSAADVNAEVVDALATDTYAEPTGVPAATDSLAGKIGRLAMALRNKITVDADYKTFHDDGGSAEWKKALSDDGTTYTEDEAEAP